MASRAQPAKAPAGMPDFRSLVEETDDLLKRQRQKGAEYKFREGPGRPQFNLEGESSPSAAAPAVAAGKDETAKMGSTGASAGAVNLDSYDPHEQAAKEQQALINVVSKMRAEASQLFAEVGALTRRYDTLKATLEQLAYEDDVDNERHRGLDRMRDLKARVQFLTLSLEDAEHYSRVLNQMTKRLSDEKLSKLATMKAFEDALKVQRHELELVQDVQRAAIKSRDQEQSELSRLQAEVKRQIASLDRKLEARRVEVKVRQDKAKWRVAKLQEELSLKAQAEGDLTEEEERAMIEKAKNLSQEASELRAEKIRAQADADAAEIEYAKIRVAAGVGAGVEAMTLESPRAGSVTGGAVEGDEEVSAGSYIAPDTQPIVYRFNTLEDEMQNIEDQLADYNNRLSTLQAQHALLRGLAEPRAKDEQDEDDRDVSALLALRERITVSKRALETASREAEEMRGLRMQLEQSVSVLMERLESIPPPVMGLGASSAHMSPEEAEQSALAMATLEELAGVQPTAWAKSVHERTLDATRALHSLIRVMDSTSASSAMNKAQAALARALAGGAVSEAFPVSAPAAFPHDAEGVDESGAGIGSSTVGGAEEHAQTAGEVEDDRRMEATIESMIVKNEWSIRVRPGSSGTNRPIKAISGRALAEAVQAFEKTWKDVSSGAVGSTQNFGASEFLPAERAANDTFSKEASRQRRRNSRIELETAYASAAVAAHGASIPTVEDTADEEAAGGRGKKKPDGKPKTKDITRFLATAAAMAGDDVDDAMIVGAGGQAVTRKSESDDVLTREKLKRNVKVATAAQQQGVDAAAPSAKR